MVILKNETGYSLIESMVGIVLLGFIVIVTMIIFTNIFSNSKLIYNKEATYLLFNETENIINNRILTDSSYFNKNETLVIQRKIEKNNNYYIAKIIVKEKKNNKVINKMSMMF